MSLLATMTRERSRRSVLRAGALVAAGGLAGCTSRGAPGESTPTPTPAATPEASPSPTATPVPSPQSQGFELLFEAGMLGQPSDVSPAQFRLTLTNVGQRTATVSAGSELLWDGGGSYPDELVIVPANKDFSGVPRLPRNGSCWEYGTDRYPSIASGVRLVALDAGDSIESRFSVYSAPSNDVCYPSGVYRMGDEVRIEGVGEPQRLAVRIAIDGFGEFSVHAAPEAISV